MITGLPADFTTALTGTSRKPVQLAVFNLGGAFYYLSDTPVGVADGLDHEYLPFIENWNVLKDTTDIDKVFQGGSLEIRSGTLTLINSPDSLSFVQLLFEYGIENIFVSLYQWFAGISGESRVLIDTMVCQDPIEISEASMLLSIDLVSVIMQNNPYLWEQEAGSQQYDIVIGKAKGVPLIDLQTARVTTLVDDMSYNVTGSILITNGIGFPGSGYVYIDSEKCAYNQINASSINITQRGVGTTARPHVQGALITIPGEDYDYAICAGPVQTVDNFIVDGEAYPNSVEFLTGQNPVVARFVNRPPWLRVATTAGIPYQGPDRVTDTYGIEYENLKSDEYPFYANNPGAINRESDEADNYLIDNAEKIYGEEELTWSQITYPDSHVNVIDNNQHSYDKIWASNTFEQLGSVDRTPTYGYTENDTTGSTFWDYDDPIIHDNDLHNLDIVVYYGQNMQFALGSYCRFRIIIRNTASNYSEVLEEQYMNSGSGEKVIWYPNPAYPRYRVSGKWSYQQLQNMTVEVEFHNYYVNTSLSTEVVRGSVEVETIRFSVMGPTTDYVYGQPWIDLTSKYGLQNSSLGAITNVQAYISLRTYRPVATEAVRSVVHRTTDDPADNSILATISDNDNPTIFGPFNLGAPTWEELAEHRIGVSNQITGPEIDDFNRISRVYIQWVKWRVTYTPGAVDTPDEERVVYGEKLTVDVTSTLGENPTPAQVVEDVLVNHSVNGNFVDTDDFLARHNEYVADGYFLNGIISGKLRLHEGLRVLLYEGLARLLFNQGTIKLLTYKTDASEVIDKAITTDGIMLRSRSIKNQPIATIKNSVELSYNKDLSNDGIYNSSMSKYDTSSINKFQSQEFKQDFNLIDLDSSAEIISYTLLNNYKYPISLYYLTVFLPDGYELEKGDKISIPSFLDETTLSGIIVSIERMFGQGKTNKINTFQIAFVTTTIYTCLETGYGNCNYGLTPYGE